MFTTWNDFERNLAHMEELRRRMTRLFEEVDETGGSGLLEAWEGSSFPRTNVVDTGAAIEIRSEVPGLSQDDLRLSFHEDVLTMSGTKRSDAPQRYRVLRQERGPVTFSRSFTFPCRVDAERTTADLKDGILTVTLPKHPESQPREISVRAS